MEMTPIQHARSLINQGYQYEEVLQRTGITNGQYYQIKREKTKHSFGCVVCSQPRANSRLFCRKHKNRYIDEPKRIAKIKASI